MFDELSGFGEKPIIHVDAGHEHEAAAQGIAALALANKQIYQRSLKIVHIAGEKIKNPDKTEVAVPHILTMPRPLLKWHLAEAATWVKFDKREKKYKQTNIPDTVVAMIESNPEVWPFSPLTGIIGTQTLRRDGSLIEMPGYDRATGYFLFDPPPMPRVPNKPTIDDAIEAIKLLDGLLVEVPFVDKVHRSVALSALMTPVLRAAVEVVPMHITNAPTGGTGKTYLFHISSMISFGERCAVMSKSINDEETEKRLIGAALDGRSIILLDNCNGRLSSEFLCQLVEQPLLTLRPLGTSSKRTVNNSFSFFGSGNNIELVFDLVRRALQCKLDTNMERPELREFRNKPVEIVKANRGKYVAAVITIARAYLEAGKPNRPTPLLSFEDWSDLVRAPLMWLEYDDPVKTIEELGVVDPARQTRSDVFRAFATLPNIDEASGGYQTNEIIKLTDEMIGPDFKYPDLREALFKIARVENGINPCQPTCGTGPFSTLRTGPPG